ncbi:MAG: T9SS type A sorting domain-containing protein [Flavobacteriales bacterium]|jgi:hypothetical protein|nr:T9SS type A sorting domain-containing protein [Flavobacteriales bacterium]
MKQTILSILALTSLLSNAQSFEEKEVELKSGYSDEVFYDITNDETEDIAGKDWNLAFGTGGISATIRFNSSRGDKLYETSFADSDWATVDTNGISTWSPVYNSSSDWNKGAFNGAGNGNPTNFGWGAYDMATHIVSGDKVYIAKIGDDFFKLFIEKLQSGSYHFQYEKIGTGNTLHQKTVQKTNHSDAFFAYYSIKDHETKEIEPKKEEWQLWFGKYIEMIPTAYGVTGVRTKPGIKVAKVENTPVNQVSYSGLDFDSTANAIGYDWKSFNMGSFSYDLTEDLSYVLKLENGDLYHLYFTAFEGSSTGKLKFKVKKHNVSVSEMDQKQTIQWFSTVNNQVILDSETTMTQAEIFDQTGRLISQEQIQTNNIALHLPKKGVYILKITNTNQAQHIIKVAL